MIFGTGLDIIEIDRIKKSLAKYSPRFENKIFTDGKSIIVSYRQTRESILLPGSQLKKPYPKVWEPVSPMKSALKILKSSTRLQVNPSSRWVAEEKYCLKN